MFIDCIDNYLVSIVTFKDTLNKAISNYEYIIHMLNLNMFT